MIHYINRLKQVITCSCQSLKKKAFAIFNIHLLQKFTKLRMEGNFLNLVKGIYKNATAKLILNGKGMNECFQKQDKNVYSQIFYLTLY